MTNFGMDDIKTKTVYETRDGKIHPSKVWAQQHAVSQAVVKSLEEFKNFDKELSPEEVRDWLWDNRNLVKHYIEKTQAMHDEVMKP